MGIFDLLSREGRAKSALAKHIKKTTDKLAKSEDRYPAMEALRDIGTDEALYGLCRRFGFVYDKTQYDEQEKQWVEDTLVSMGDRALPPLRRYLLAGESLSYPLRVLEKIAPPDKVLEIVDEVCAREEPGYTRNPQKKIQLLTWLGEWSEAGGGEVARRVVPYLTDFDETVRFTAVEALAHASADEASSRTPLLAALVRPEEESRRVLVRVAEVLAQRGWRVGDEHREAVAAVVAGKLPEFSLEKDKLVKKARPG
jgi:hypothetical protein